MNPIQTEQIEQLKFGSVLIGYLDPHSDLDRFNKLAEKNISAFSMELIPRISRAQAMDALSSQASIAGYKAVLMASNLLGKFFPMLTTAAGTIRPSKVLVIGVGVAGLQAIATARRLGAIVEGYDVRAAVKEQVESLGAKFVDVGIKAEGSGGYARELTEEEKKQQQDILAQHKIWELTQLLTDKGVSVKFAIHPVAGRMPGHMNVLLAEAGVPYDMIYDMDDVNADFKNTTVTLVIGANDVVNPSAKNDTSSPLYGMPILDAMDSDNVIVIKRGRGTGFSGVENPLFFADNTKMLFGDGQKAASELIQAVKEL